MSDRSTAAVDAKRPARWLRRLCIVAALLVLLGFALPTIIARTGLRDRLINAIIAAPNLATTTERASFGWFSPLSVEASVNRLFPTTTDWVFQMSSDERFMQAAFGPPGAPIPALPAVPTEMGDIRLEAWLRSTDEEAKSLADLSKQPLARQLVQRYLEASLPELAALAKERTVDAADGWVVIRIGAPTPN